MKAEIADAIASQRHLELRYHDYNRIVEPHAYGRDKGGYEILRCFQLSGGSESGQRTGWKLLKVTDIYFVHGLEDKFQLRPDYKKNDKAMEYIFCQL